MQLLSLLLIMLLKPSLHCCCVFPLLGMERVVFYRERGALPYDPFAYGVAIALVEIPYLLIQVRCCSPAAGVLWHVAQHHMQPVS